MTTGTYYLDGAAQFMQPNDYGKWVFVVSNIEKIEDPEQRKILAAIAETKMYGIDTPEDLTSRLSGEALSIYRYITNSKAELSQQLLSDLPAPMQDEIMRLDLASKNLSALKAKLILIHGKDDNIIPYTQSIALRNALPASQVRLYLLENWTHVEPESEVLDAWQLFSALHQLLRLRDTPNSKNQ